MHNSLAQGACKRLFHSLAALGAINTHAIPQEDVCALEVTTIMFEDGIGCQYNNTAVQAKLHQIAAALAPLVKHLDFAAPDCLEVASSRNY